MKPFFKNLSSIMIGLIACFVYMFVITKITEFIKNMPFLWFFYDISFVFAIQSVVIYKVLAGPSILAYIFRLIIIAYYIYMMGLLLYTGQGTILNKIAMIITIIGLLYELRYSKDDFVEQ